MRTLDARLRASNVAVGFGFLEGPRFRDGVIYTADFYRQQVFRIDVVSGAVETVCAVAQQPSGLAFGADGSLFVVSMLDRRVLRLSGEGLSEFADLSHITDRPINDMTIDALDRLYVGAFGRREDGDLSIHPTPITMVDCDGAPRVVSMDLCYPNGLAFDATGTTLYAADTFGSRLAIFDVLDDGGLALRDFYRFGPTAYDHILTAVASGDFLPDGIALDAAGRVWVADARSASVGIYDPSTRLAAVVPIDGLEDHVYAVEIAPDGRMFACVAPRMGSWDTASEFPSRLVQLRWAAGGDSLGSLDWQPSR